MSHSSSFTWAASELAPRQTGRCPKSTTARLVAQLPVLFALGAVTYFGSAYLPAAVGYYGAVRQAHSFVQTHASLPTKQAVRALVAGVRAETGLDLDPADVRVRRAGAQISNVAFKLKVPLHFPMWGGGRMLALDVAAGACPKGD